MKKGFDDEVKQTYKLLLVVKNGTAKYSDGLPKNSLTAYFCKYVQENTYMCT